MHPTVVYDATDPGEVERARRAFEAILALALALGGTITGEHGVGLLKRPYLAGELGDAHDLHRAIKAALDPPGVFNPGKASSPRTSTARIEGSRTRRGRRTSRTRRHRRGDRRSAAIGAHNVDILRAARSDFDVLGPLRRQRRAVAVRRGDSTF